ncbi:glutamate--tRNA ligase [Holosporaceae bacterium 'Namur']|nr:glutamate--tRNA ligase [Holosporaceae bacterium 'Namur']
MKVITRFAPSPTGFLHIGSARTALFNWLYAKHKGGEFLLRIEDTDKERSTDEAIDAIIDGMKWLGLGWNRELVFQSKNEERHREVAYKLLNMGKAYYCYSSPEEIAEFREKNPNQKFQSSWRDKDESEAPAGVKPVIRLKASRSGETVVEDFVRGKVVVQNAELDDMVLLRSDGSPTYMLAVVVDDFDMQVNHVIRGDDHFTNTFRQKQIIEAMGWPVPKYAHIPLINGSDGAKLSKRHGALGVQAYREMGYLPEALKNYLLRLGWSHGDDEIFSEQKAIELFDVEGLGKSPSRFDFDKLDSINAYYIANSDDNELLKLISPALGILLDDIYAKRILSGMPGLKVRAKTLNELKEGAKIYISKSKPLDERSSKVLNDEGRQVISKLLPLLKNILSWTKEELEKKCSEFAATEGVKPTLIMQLLRAGVIGTFAAPGIYEVAEILGKEEVLTRISEVV